MKRRKPKAARKESVVMVRMTAEQKDALAEGAARRGLDLSGWLRHLGLREVEQDHRHQPA